MLDAIAQWTGQVHWIILKPLKPIIALPQTKNNQILWKRSKAKFLNHTHLCSSCLDASNDLQAILLLGHFHPSGTWNDYCLLNWKPLPRLHIDYFSFFVCLEELTCMQILIQEVIIPTQMITHLHLRVL